MGGIAVPLALAGASTVLLSWTSSFKAFPFRCLVVLALALGISGCELEEVVQGRYLAGADILRCCTSVSAGMLDSVRIKGLRKFISDKHRNESGIVEYKNVLLQLVLSCLIVAKDS